MHQSESPRFILHIRLSTIRDIAMASGLAAALRRTHLEARIDWLA